MFAFMRMNGVPLSPTYFLTLRLLTPHLVSNSESLKMKGYCNVKRKQYHATFPLWTPFLQYTRHSLDSLGRSGVWCASGVVGWVNEMMVDMGEGKSHRGDAAKGAQRIQVPTASPPSCLRAGGSIN